VQDQIAKENIITQRAIWAINPHVFEKVRNESALGHYEEEDKSSHTTGQDKDDNFENSDVESGLHSRGLTFDEKSDSFNGGDFVGFNENRGFEKDFDESEARI
jgi:hypothetical protein